MSIYASGEKEEGVPKDPSLTNKQVAFHYDFNTISDLVEGLETTKIADSPENGNTYGRKDGAWTVVDAVGGGVQTVSGAKINNADPSNPVVLNQDADEVDDTSTTNKFTTSSEISKLGGIETGAEVNNISDANATDLTDTSDSSLHFHVADRERANHTGTQAQGTITDLTTDLATLQTNIDSLTPLSIAVVAAKTFDTADGNNVPYYSTHVSDVNYTINAGFLEEGKSAMFVQRGTGKFTFVSGTGSIGSFDNLVQSAGLEAHIALTKINGSISITGQLI